MCLRKNLAQKNGDEYTPPPSNIGNKDFYFTKYGAKNYFPIFKWEVIFSTLRHSVPAWHTPAPNAVGNPRQHSGRSI